MRYNNPKAKEMQACYEQSGEWANGSILTRHERESDKAYTRRMASFTSPAIYSYLIDGYNCLFSSEPSRYGADELYSEHFTYSAGYGLPLSSVMSIAIKKAMVMGSCFLVVDSFAEQENTYESMLVNRTYPFVEIIDPPQVTALELDRVGNVVKFAYNYVQDNITYTRCYTPFVVIDSGIDGTEKAYEIPVRMPVIPISPTHHLISDELPPSPTMGLYQMQLGIANTLSYIAEEMAQACFPLLVVNSTESPKSASLGVANGLHLPIGASASYLSPASNTIDSKLKFIESQLALMIKTQINLLSSGDAQSGIAKMLDRAGNVGSLRSLASYLEKREYLIYEIFCQWLKVTPSKDYTVRYFKNFDESNIQEYLNSASEVLGMDVSDETKFAIKREIITKMFSEDELLVSELIEAESTHVPTSPSEVDQIESLADLDRLVL